MHWKAFRDLAREAMDEVGLELKVEAFGVLWKARLVDEVILGSCLMAVETANGLRRTNAIFDSSFKGVCGVDDVARVLKVIVEG